MSTEYPFRIFLTDSFAALHDEVPPVYTEMCRRLSPHEIALHVDDELVWVRFTPEDARVLDAPARPTIDVQTSRSTIIDLIDAASTMAEAVLADRLRLRGRTEDLLAFHDGLIAYLHGAFRAPSFRNLLPAFRISARAGSSVPPRKARVRRVEREESA